MSSRSNTEFPRGRAWGACALIFCATLIAYFPALKGGFIWDDNGYVTAPSLQTLHGLWRIWFEVGATEGYYPLMHSAFWVEHRLWGEAPLGYHLVNVILHAVAACLLGMALGRLKIRGAFFASLIFALHPVCVESVAWVSEQKNVLCAVFYLLAALAYLKWEGGGRPRSLPWYFAASILFVAALMSKTLTATLPAGLLLMFWWRKGRLSWKGDVLPLIPWFAIGASAGLFSAWVERAYFGARGGAFDLNLVQRILLAGRIFWFYLGKLLWPANLIFIYPRWHVDAGAWWQYLFPLAAAALVVALCLLQRRARGVLTAFLFFIGTLFPTMGFFNIYGFFFSYVADHWQYLPSIGIFALIGAGFEYRAKRQDIKAENRPGGCNPVASLGARFFQVAVLCLLGVLTWRQCRMYRDGQTLYQTVLDRNPSAWMAHNNLGIIMAAAGRLPEAIDHYEQALRLEPDFPAVHNDLGTALVGAGRLPEAIEQFRTAVRLDPTYAEAMGNLGDVFMQMGRTQEAVPYYLQALGLRPNDAQAHNNLGIAFSQLGRGAEAADQFAAASRLEPDNTEIRFNLGTTLVELGRTVEARAQFEEVLRLKPDDAEARESLAHLPYQDSK